MITPLVQEDVWLETLQGLPEWMPSTDAIVLLSPHPDDETLAAGGLILQQRARGVDVFVVAVTDGEHAYADNAGLADTRQREQAEALACLSVPKGRILRLHLTDSSVHGQEQELIAALLPFVTERTHLVAPWRGDFHPDHEACGRAAEELSRLTGAQLTSYFFWTWHRGTPATLAPFLEAGTLRSFALSEDTLAAKTGALACHRSQLAWATEPPILPDNLLAPARRMFEVFMVNERESDKL